MPWDKIATTVSASVGASALIGAGLVKIAKGTFQTITGCEKSNLKCVETQIKPMCEKIDKIQSMIKAIDESRINDKFEAIAARKNMEDKLALEVKENREIIDSHYAELKGFMGSINGKLSILIKNGEK